MNRTGPRVWQMHLEQRLGLEDLEIAQLHRAHDDLREIRAASGGRRAPRVGVHVRTELVTCARHGVPEDKDDRGDGMRRSDCVGGPACFGKLEA
ncbi:hypothetical protein BKA93DRAFT_802907 [Sparassis latifolia]